MDRGAWGATVHGVSKSWMQMSTWAAPVDTRHFSVSLCPPSALGSSKTLQWACLLQLMSKRTIQVALHPKPVYQRTSLTHFPAPGSSLPLKETSHDPLLRRTQSRQDSGPGGGVFRCWKDISCRELWKRSSLCLSCSLGGSLSLTPTYSYCQAPRRNTTQFPPWSFRSTKAPKTPPPITKVTSVSALVRSLPPLRLPGMFTKTLRINKKTLRENKQREACWVTPSSFLGYS